MSDTYKIKFRCWNCLAEFDKEIPKGKRAESNAGACTHCGIESVVNTPEKSHETLFLIQIHKD